MGAVKAQPSTKSCTCSGSEDRGSHQRQSLNKRGNDQLCDQQLYTEPVSGSCGSRTTERSSGQNGPPKKTSTRFQNGRYFGEKSGHPQFQNGRCQTVNRCYPRLC